MVGAAGAAKTASDDVVKPTPTSVAASANDAPAVAIVRFLLRSDILGLPIPQARPAG
jgi:hypothetical protein